LLVTGGLYYRSHPSKRLTGKDTIVLADFANSTGDAVFDDTLKTALNISLRQSPYLSVLSDSEVAKTLQQMTRPVGTKLTPEVARELCLRAGSKAYLAGSVSSLGSKYVLGFKAVNCKSGDTLAEEQVTAASKEKVLDALGGAASKLRGELGESLATVQMFDKPLDEASTPSLAALKAYTTGMRTNLQTGSHDAIPFFREAVDLDTHFALAYVSLGIMYSNLNQASLAAENARKAYEFRERATEREKFLISAEYYFDGTGQIEKAIEVCKVWSQNYPRDWIPHNLLGSAYRYLGRHEDAMSETEQSLRLNDDDVIEYGNLARTYIFLERVNDAKTTLHEAVTHKLDDTFLRKTLYVIGFLEGDTRIMDEQAAWAMHKTGS
jgi:eukaryotic-like serine/threonine-protein kinase